MITSFYIFTDPHGMLHFAVTLAGHCCGYFIDCWPF